MSRRISLIVVAVLALAYGLVSVHPAYKRVENSKHARDYATYHYAVAEAVDGGDPYDTQALSKRARADKSRKRVHPFFYPPPFLLTMPWAVPLELSTAYKAFFWLSQLCILGTLVVMRRWILRATSWVAAVAAPATTFATRRAWRSCSGGCCPTSKPTNAHHTPMRAGLRDARGRSGACWRP